MRQGFMLITEEMLGIDNRRVEFKTFTVANSEDYYICGWEHIKDNFKAHVNEIQATIERENGESGYIGVRLPDKKYFEIQWD